MKTALHVMGLIAIALIAAAVCPAQTQVGNYGVRYTFTSPAGQSCGTNTPMTILQPAGSIYTCQSGTMTAVGAGSGMVYPPVGIGVSTGSAWGASINPATLATWPAVGIPVSTGTAWGTSINPSTLAAWPQVMLCNATPCAFSYLPAFNNSPTTPGWSPPTTTLNAGLWLQNPWPNGVAMVAAQGPIGGTQVASIYSTGIDPANVALLSRSGTNLFAVWPASVAPTAFPAAQFVGSTNDLNTAGWCGQFQLANPFPANMPPNVAANNAAVPVPLFVMCNGATPATPGYGTTQVVIDTNAGGIVWFRSSLSSGNWTTWKAGGFLTNLTVATLPTCNAAAQGAVAAVTDATAPTFLGTLTGGGTVYTPVVCNGTAWVSH